MSAFDHLRDGQISHGFFGHHTATIDWCELNYEHSPYVAEFYNSLTNLPAILLGIYGCWASLKGGLRKRYALAYLGATGIGLGSFGFHATLKWEWQLMDELPMIYLVSYCGYLILDTLPGFTPRFGLVGPVVLLAWDIFVTLSYIYLPNPVYHQIAFGGILLSFVSRNFLFMRQLAKRPGVNSKKQEDVLQILVTGIATFVLGFIIWNIDNFFCDALRRGREVLGPLGFVLEGHGYWHILTAYGSFQMLTASIYLQLATKTTPEAYDFDTSAWFPVCYRAAPPASLQKPTGEEVSKRIKVQ